MLKMLPTLPPGPAQPAMWQLMRYTVRPLAFLEDCGRRFGETFTVKLAGYGTFVMLTSPEAIKDVFRGSPVALHSGEGNEFLSPSLGRNSVLVLDEEPHARQRRVLLPPLQGEAMRAHTETMRAATEKAIAGWPLNRPLRLDRPMREITLRVILQVAMGLESSEELDDLSDKVRRVLDSGGARYTLVLLKLIPQALLRGSSWAPFYRQLRVLDAALYRIIARRRVEPPDAERRDVLSILLASTHENGQPPSDEEIRDALVTLLFAGHETTATALAWAFTDIVPRCDVVERIRNELQSVTGDEPLRSEHVPRLEYLDAVVREVLRLRTVLPFVVRLLKVPFTAGGAEYPAGIHLAPCSHLVHRREDLYPEPEQFRPERFLQRKFTPYEWLPFGGGNRMCLGMAFAMYEMMIVLATAIARLELKRPDGVVSRPARRGLVVAPSDGAQFIVTRRREA